MISLPKFLWRHCKEYKWSFGALLGMSVIWAANLSLSPYLLKVLIDEATVNGSLFLPGLQYVAVTFTASIALRIYDWLFLSVLPKMKSQIIAESFTILQKHPLGYFQERFSGSLGSKINELAKASSFIVQYLIDQIIARVFSFGIGILTMYLVHPLFAYMFIAWSSLFILSSVLLLRRSQKYAEEASIAASAVVGKLVDSISNIFMVKAYARENYESDYLQKSLDHSVSQERALLKFLMKIKIFYAASMTFLMSGILWLLVVARGVQMITVGDFALILTLATVLVRDILLMTSQLVQFSEQIGTCKQALTIHNLPSVLEEPKEELQVPQGEIIFDQISFGYQKGLNLFDDKSVAIKAGSRVGIVGVSGSGKTTLASLVLRLFDLRSGKILVDGQDISQVSLESLRKHIAIIPQEPMLFHRSLLENIRYGKLNATDEEVIAAAIKAHCHEFIEKLPLGYHSLVGERGVKLSGGQKQRIAIARAMLKDAPILILDEATASLDSATEADIQKSLLSLMQGKTTIVIAHRLTTLSRLDRILVLEKGKIVEDGTHNELLERNGLYHQLWNC